MSGDEQGFGLSGGRGKRPPVAIVGMAVLMPKAADLQAYWRNLVDGVDAITDVPSGRWDAGFYDPKAVDRSDRVYCRRGGFVDELAQVEVTRFGIMPNSVAGTEPEQLIALQVAAEAIADAGGEQRLPDRDRIGVILGRGGYLSPGLSRGAQCVLTSNQLVRTLGELLPELGADQLERVRQAYTRQLGPDEPEQAIGLVPNLTASRIANRLDLRGPAYTVDAACASSLVAVDQAVGELAGGRCDLVLAGGVHHCHDITLWSVFARLRALSASQRIRPFDQAADGLLIGEGTGVVALKRLCDALRDGDRIYAVVRGTGVASDGRSGSLVNPDPSGQVTAVRKAWRAAGLDPAEPGSIGLLEAHGTATPSGDAAELATLAEVFGPPGDEDRPVIGSVKSMIGHTMPAAGVAGMVKAALAVYHGVLPPTLHCQNPHPALAHTRFRPIDAARAWETGGGQRIRRAGVNAFGFGGINAHVVLEEAPDAAPRTPIRPTATVREPERVLRLAADGPQALAALLDADDPAVLAAGLDRPVPDAGRTRLGVVDPTGKRLALARRAVAKGRPWRGRGDVWFTPEPLLGGATGGRLAFVFPGLEAEFEPHVRDVAQHFGLSALLPSLRAGEFADVADVGRHAAEVIGVGRVLDAALRRMRIVPDAVAGHSVGEWTAMATAGLYAGGAVDEFAESFDPDQVRVPGLAFAVLGAPADQVAAAIEDRPEVVLSHDNAPNQSMVCGPPGPVEELVRWFRARRVFGQVLPFQSGFHTPMLAPYLDQIRHYAGLFELHPPTVPVWSATTASVYPSTEQQVRELFLRHLLEPVRFRPLIEAMYADGFRVFVQAGTGQVNSLIDNTLHGRPHLAISANSPHRGGLAQLLRVATALWVDGGEPDVERLAAKGDAPARRAPMQLDLNGRLVSLDRDTIAGVRSALAVRRPVSGATGSELTALERLSDRFPMAAELRALLQDTADTAAALTAADAARPHSAAPAVSGGRSTAAGPQMPEGRELRTVLRVSTDAMPYLRDHCFFVQRPGWPDEADRWPVVPATTLIHHMMELAERDRPGSRAVAVHQVQLNRWVTAAPAVDVPVTVTPREDTRAGVTFDQFASAQVELAAHHSDDPPRPWQWDSGSERLPEITAGNLYSDRWMFHGPLFQGVTELTAIGEAHVRGVLTTPPAPGALLDNVGQLLGYWIITTLNERTMVFPIRMGHIRFFGPHPVPGTQVDCLIRITSVTDSAVEADMQLLVEGRMWAEITGWRDHRFDNHPETRAQERFPERNTLSRVQQGGWSLVFDRCRDLASRDLVMRRHLSSAELVDYEKCPPRGRRQWLLGRIAVKDAVRQWLWDHGEGPVFPAEIRVSNDEDGRPRVTGLHGRTLPELDVTLAHRAEAGVALVRPHTRHGRCGVGIDVEEVAERTEQTRSVALDRAERELLAALCAASGEPEALWFTRFWAAKEAVSKAEGTGLRGRPRDFVVVAAQPDDLMVDVGGRRHQVHCRRIGNPADLPSRDYVVAWTTGLTDGQETEQ
ncbi:acyl transferase domain-containing protein/phosphopantetheinyl transferase [Streptomyces griseochromogenes]|uniref:Acyl transferase domain-containing protein/phosphopantetheinyl transferase n=1 Tax=Streptomyces griseochromogenes TaxID=68214 RepID=A0A1B1AZK4_9ACTN|nr:type I polyketide synthase [Streptomyces griseochromogenes]ANP51941.1 beta-ketoacyl synthase [Streptomyces griseochromogenes]MBP2056613.1 acyl transferase domain-containing protein/phosphopantetheinyl transferase [Streptomyces griseochromogenes]